MQLCQGAHAYIVGTSKLMEVNLTEPWHKIVKGNKHTEGKLSTALPGNIISASPEYEI
jgi:hypothetical protein